MPLGGSGAIMGALILAAIANPDPAAIPAFATLGDTIAIWCLGNVSCLAGTMTAAGSAVTGAGIFTTSADENDLGPKLAVAMKDPSPQGIAKWTAFARAFISHLKTFGQVDPSTFVAAPTGGPLTGTGKVKFTSLVFAPLLSSQLGVTDAVAGAMLEVFGLQILTHIQQYAQVLPIAIVAPFVPYTAPNGGGPITGAGSFS